MNADWNLVTLQHIEQACHLYDTGSEIPKRPAQTTFLVLHGRLYPGKFIRGLAYRLATGIELDPNQDYSGGRETMRFYQNLGLATEQNGTSTQKAVTKLGSLTASIKLPEPLHPIPFERLEPTKQSSTTRIEVARSILNPLPAPGSSRSIRRIALVSHDYNTRDLHGLYDYSEHFDRINHLCDGQACDTILYSLYTWHRTAPMPRTHDAFFTDLDHIERIILEVGQPLMERFDHVEVWRKGEETPSKVWQRFATSTASASEKEAFLDELEQRRIGDALLVLCGETNIASLRRDSDVFNDPYDFAGRLRTMNVRIILNPIHDYMRRYEMRAKRRYYSREGRTVISVWNQGKGKESHLPWTVFHNGKELTEDVRELPRPFFDRPDIRIGIFDLP